MATLLQKRALSVKTKVCFSISFLLFMECTFGKLSNYLTYGLFKVIFSQEIIGWEFYESP